MAVCKFLNSINGWFACFNCISTIFLAKKLKALELFFLGIIILEIQTYIYLRQDYFVTLLFALIIFIWSPLLPSFNRLILLYLMWKLRSLVTKLYIILISTLNHNIWFDINPWDHMKMKMKKNDISISYEFFKKIDPLYTNFRFV